MPTPAIASGVVSSSPRLARREAPRRSEARVGRRNVPAGRRRGSSGRRRRAADAGAGALWRSSQALISGARRYATTTPTITPPSPRSRTPPARRCARPCRTSARRCSRARRSRGPEAGADDAVRDEAPVGQPRGAGDERRQRADEADEAADQDRLAAVPVEVALHLLEPLLRDLDARAVLVEERRPSRRPMKKLVVSPSTAQSQTSPISGSRSISPWPAITPRPSPPSRPARPGRRMRRSRGRPPPPTSAYVHGPSAWAMSSITFSGPAAREHAAGVDAEREHQRRAERRRSRPSLRQRQTTTPPPARRQPRRRSAGPTSSPEATSARRLTRRAGDRRGGRSAAAGSRRGRRRWGPSRSPRRRARPPRRALEPSRRGSGRSESAAGWRSFSRAGGELGRRRRGERAQRLGVELLPRAAEPVELGVDLGRREPLGVRHEHDGERRQLDRLHPLARALHQAWRGLDLARHVGAEAGGEPRSSAASSGEPASSLATRRAAAASALPPPSPAATGMRLSIRARAAAARRQRARGIGAGRGRRGCRPRTPGQSTLSRAGLARRSARRRARATRTGSRSGAGRPRAGGPTCRTRLTLA